jgi:DNA-binding NtrC family response regulator
MESIPTRKTPLLAVDDDEGALLSIKATLVGSGMPEPALVSDGRRVMDLAREYPFQLVLLDLMMPHVSGMDLLKQIKEEFPNVECIIVTAVDEVDSAVQAMRFGAYDYLVKPINAEKLIITTQRALERYNLREGLALFERRQSFSDLKDPSAFRGMVAEDAAMARVFHQVEVAAPTDYNLMITGESGTGKEMLARIVHDLSGRSKGPFVPVSMAAFSKTLFEDEFFGHTKGAYTDAQSDKKGFFETAQGGTIFLDEVTELEPDLQGKLLRVIQERELYRLGSTTARDIDVRIIAASNRDVPEEMKTGRFRSDLFYRLNILHVSVPPLRERKKDILPLSLHFLRIHADKTQKEIDSLEPELIARLLAYPFPGNVRELQNMIASAVLMETDKTLRLSSVAALASQAGSAPGLEEDLLTLEEVERRHICRILDSVGGNRTQAAKILGIGLRTLQRKLKEYDDARQSS